MANINTQTIRVDLSTDKMAPTAFTHQNDTARTLEFSMYNKGVPYDMTGNTVKFAYKSPIVNGQYSVIAGASMASGTVSDNKVTVTLPSAYTAISGVGLLTMIITPSSGTIRPVNIRLVVQKSADGADVIAGASDFVPVLEEYMSENMQTFIDEWLDEHPEATTTVEDGSITAQKLNSDFLAQVDNDFVTLQMYGGVCDGVEDDTTAFESALRYASQNGKRVLIKTFDVVKITNAVFVPSNTHLIINGKIVCNYGATACLETFDRVSATPGYTGTHDILIEGFGTIDGGGSISTLYAVTPIRIHHSRNVVIRDITIKDWVNNHAIETSSENVIIDNVKFLGCVQTTSQGNHSEAVQIDICTSGSASGAIPYDNTKAKNTTIKNCTFAPSEAGNLYSAIGNHGEVFDDSFGTMYSGVYIYNNVFQYARDNAINLLMNIEDIEIINNRFENQIFAGSTLNDGNILMVYYIRDAVIKGNTFINANGTGINLGYIGDAGSGAYANDWMTNIDVSENTFYDYCTRNSNNSGIILAHKCKAVTITNNTFNTINNIGANPVRVQDATNTPQYLINTVIDANYYNGKIISYGTWSNELTVGATFQIPNIMMNASRIHLFCYRYAIGGNTVISMADIKAGYVASGTAIYIDNEHYFKFTIDANGLLTMTEKGASSGDPYIKVEMID